MGIPKHIHEACDTIDAGMFTGDIFDDAISRDTLRDWIARWEREMKRLDELEVEWDEYRYTCFGCNTDLGGDVFDNLDHCPVCGAVNFGDIKEDEENNDEKLELF